RACEAVGRDPATLEKTVAVLLKFDDQPSRRSAGTRPITGPTERMAETLAEFAATGIGHVQLVLDPVTLESIERAAEVKASLSSAWPSHPLAGRRRRLADPRAQPLVVEIVVLADVEIADLLVLRRLRGERIQRGPFQELDLHVARVAAERQEPPVVFRAAIEGLVPFHRLAHLGDRLGDQPVEVLSHSAFPPGHGGDV